MAYSIPSLPPPPPYSSSSSTRPNAPWLHSSLLSSILYRVLGFAHSYQVLDNIHDHYLNIQCQVRFKSSDIGAFCYNKFDQQINILLILDLLP